ncbi:MAG: hypothetical protein ACRD27_11920 [Terracidiphilus sp.]
MRKKASRGGGDSKQPSFDALQAAATDMTPGMNQLKNLQTKIAAPGNDMKEGAAIALGIDKAIAALTALV